MTTMTMTVSVTWTPIAHPAASPDVLGHGLLPTSIRSRGQVCPQVGGTGMTGSLGGVDPRGRRHGDVVSGVRASGLSTYQAHAFVDTGLLTDTGPTSPVPMSPVPTSPVPTSPVRNEKKYDPGISVWRPPV